MIKFSVLLAAAALAVASPAKAELILEQKISFLHGDRKIVGALTKPATDTPRMVVLILHGMSGNRDGARINHDGRGLFERTAKVLAGKGIASLRFSTGGRGGSQGLLEDMTLTRRLEESLAALDWISRQAGLDSARIALIGHSQGTIVAAALAKRRPDRIDNVVMWAPNANPVATYKRAIGESAFARSLATDRDEIIEWHSAGGTKRRFKAAYFHDLGSFDTARDIAEFPGRLLVITGAQDRISPTHSAQILSASDPTATRHAEFDFDHRMGASAGVDEVDRLVRFTYDWLNGG